MVVFYADEDFPGPVTEALRALGCDVLTVQEDGRMGNGDPAVLTRAVALGRCVLTKNRKDVYRLHAANPLHAGIVTIRDDPDRAALAARIHAAVTALPSVAGRLVRVNRPHPSAQP
jgi:predicted nuclease of predicted toxin-antitoxin system